MTLGDGVQVGYFAQAHDQLDPAKRVIDELWARRRLSETEARRYLAHYLFRGDDVFKRVRELSGGERGRLALALLALAGANFLLLDEPTNHLDIPSQEVLQEVLEGFNGTILLVSHDRYLVDRLAQHIWSIEEGELLTFAASYRDYLALREGEEEQESGVAGEQGREDVSPLGPQEEVQGSVGVGEQGGETTPPRPVGEGSAPPRTGWSRSARRQDERRRRALETELEDAEYWLARTGEAVESARAVDTFMLPELEAEHAAAQERVEELLAELELLN